MYYTRKKDFVNLLLKQKTPEDLLCNRFQIKNVNLYRYHRIIFLIKFQAFLYYRNIMI